VTNNLVVSLCSLVRIANSCSSDYNIHGPDFNNSFCTTNRITHSMLLICWCQSHAGHWWGTACQGLFPWFSRGSQPWL